MVPHEIHPRGLPLAQRRGAAVCGELLDHAPGAAARRPLFLTRSARRGYLQHNDGERRCAASCSTTRRERRRAAPVSSHQAAPRAAGSHGSRRAPRLRLRGQPPSRWQEQRHADSLPRSRAGSGDATKASFRRPLCCFRFWVGLGVGRLGAGTGG
jgi:hypothetical protein